MVRIQLVSVLFRFWSIVSFLCFEFGLVGPLVFFFPKNFCLGFFFKKNAVFKPIVFWPFYAL